MDINDLKDWMVSRGGKNVTSAYGFSNTKLRVDSEHSPTYYQVELIVTDEGNWSMMIYEHDTIDHELVGQHDIKEIYDYDKFVNSLRKRVALKQLVKNCRCVSHKSNRSA